MSKAPEFKPEYSVEFPPEAYHGSGSLKRIASSQPAEVNASQAAKKFIQNTGDKNTKKAKPLGRSS